YPEIKQAVDEIGARYDLKTLIQVDSYRPASIELNNKISDEILKGLSLLQLLTPAHVVTDPFGDFKSAFGERYGEEFVPLTEVLDTESGIGYGKFAITGMEESPLIDKLPLEKE